MLNWEPKVKGYAMKPFLTACVAAIAIAVISGIVLNSIQEPAAQGFSTSSVRLDA